MTESFNLLRRVQSLDISPELSGYSRVTIYAGQDEEGKDKIYTAGDDTGTTLEITNEWGTPEMAKAILKKIQGWRYQPYKAGGSSIDPSSEIGDAVSVSDIYGGIFAKKTTYGKYIRTDLEAPSKEEVEHEFQVQSPTDRQYARFTSDVRSKLTIQAGEIAARVEKTYGKNDKGEITKSFWWSLQPESWEVGNQNGRLFGVYEGYTYVEGEIRATSGSIGGFTIKNGYLCTNGQEWDGSNSSGIYIGPEGIKCGNSFEVDASGNGTFDGTIKCQDLYIKQGNNYVQITPDEAVHGFSGGNGWYTNGAAVTNNASRGSYARSLFEGTQDYTAKMDIGEISCVKLYIGGSTFYYNSQSIKDYYGDYHTFGYWTPDEPD